MTACLEHDIDFLGDVPLHASICQDADKGKPTVVAKPESHRARAFMEIAHQVGIKVGLYGGPKDVKIQ